MPSRLILRLLVVFTRKLEILVTTLSSRMRKSDFVLVVVVVLETKDLYSRSSCVSQQKIGCRRCRVSERYCDSSHLRSEIRQPKTTCNLSRALLYNNILLSQSQ